MEELISTGQIRERVAELGAQITADYKGKDLVCVCVIRGAIYFFADLTREIALDYEIDVLGVSSYGSGTESAGEVNVTLSSNADYSGKDILIIEDIVDSGNTISFLVNDFFKNANSVRVASFLSKPSRRVKQVDIHYLGFEVPDKFVVGYGLDYEQKYRGLPYVASLS